MTPAGPGGQRRGLSAGIAPGQGVTTTPGPEPPPAWALLESCLGDFGVAPAVPYREIDRVEVPAERAAGVAEGLAAVGQFPVR